MRPIVIRLPLLFVLTLATPALASDGILEINQTCAVQTGCFPGDSPGFPVTVSGAVGRSVRLTSDLVVTSNLELDGILVTAEAISIDLNGFQLTGAGACTQTGSAVACNAGNGRGIDAEGRERVVVMNGQVMHFAGGGVVLGDFARVEDVTVEANAAVGIETGDASIIRTSIAYRNGGHGLSMGRGSVVESCSAIANKTFGIALGRGSVSGSTALENGWAGIAVGSGSAISGSSSHENETDGIHAGEGSIVSKNATYRNENNGIVARAGTLVEENVARENGVNDSSGNGLVFPDDIGHGVAYRGNLLTENASDAITGLPGVNLGSNHCAGPGVNSPTCPR